MPGTDDEGRTSRFNQTPLTQTGRRKRTRVFTSDDRATHRVIEKQRREALNTQFLELARLLPALATTRRLSKSVIVSESIAHQKKQREQRLACARQVRAMRVEQEALLAEINSLRVQVGITDRKVAQPLSAEVLETLAVEDEVFGAFPAGFGDNGDDAAEADDDMGLDADEERPDRSAVRRSRRSVSRSMSNASTSRSPAGSMVTHAAGAIFISPSPPAQSEVSPGSPASDAQSSDALRPSSPSLEIPSVYDPDFLALFSVPNPSIDQAPISFGFPPTTNLVSQNTAFANQLPLGMEPKLNSGTLHRAADPPEFDFNAVMDVPQPDLGPRVDDIWSLDFFQQHSGDGLFETGAMAGFPVDYSPQIVWRNAIHSGTHGGFTV